MRKSVIFGLLILVILIGGIISILFVGADKYQFLSKSELKINKSEYIIFCPNKNCNYASSDIKKLDAGVYSVKLTEKEFKNMQKDKKIKIYEQKKYTLFLQNSTKIINATSTWNLKLQDINLTGAGQTICIIDTGVNYSHPDLGNGYGPNYKILAGYDVVYGPLGYDFDDGEGHGTHVAGIAAANGIIKGAALGANLVIIAAFTYGPDVFYTADLILALDQCIDNATRYNISVISMSLGGGQNNSFCDNEDPAFSAKIQEAIDKNISVVIATGNINGGYTNAVAGISDPACFENVTRVGATNKEDTYASYGFRNSNFSDILFAPGTSINSTSRSLSYEEKSGTSMATPHVAGAIAIINQYLALTGRTRTPKQIVAIFNNSGKRIYDSASGINYSRIDVYSAIDYLEIPAINYSGSTLASGGIIKGNSILVNVSASDLGFKNLSINLYNSSGLVNSSNTSLTNLQTNFTNLADGMYFFNATVYDIWGNMNFTQTRNITLNNIPSLNIIYPINNTWYNGAKFNTSLDVSGSCSFSLNNQANITMNALNSTSFSFVNLSIAETLTNSTYNVTFHCNDTLGNSNHSSLIFFGVEKTPPVLVSTSVSKSSSSAIVYYNSNESISASVNYGSDFSLGNIASNIEFSDSSSITLSSLSASTLYYYNLTICDQAQNCVTNGTYNFTTDAAPPSSSSGGGGSGSSTTVAKTYLVSEKQALLGYTRDLKTNEVLSFSSSSASSEISSSSTGSASLSNSVKGHTLTINKVGSTFVNLTLRSNPINVILYVGEEKKINTTSDYYDFYLKLNSIKASKANITIKEIHEEIITRNKTIISNETISNVSLTAGEDKNNSPSVDFSKLKIYFVIAVIIIILFILYKTLFRKVEVKTKKRSFMMICHIL